MYIYAGIVGAPAQHLLHSPNSFRIGQVSCQVSLTSLSIGIYRLSSKFKEGEGGFGVGKPGALS